MGRGEQVGKLDVPFLYFWVKKKENAVIGILIKTKKSETFQILRSQHTLAEHFHTLVEVIVHEVF